MIILNRFRVPAHALVSTCTRGAESDWAVHHFSMCVVYGVYYKQVRGKSHGVCSVCDCTALHSP